MKIPVIITLVLLALTDAVLAKISPTQLTCEYLKDPQIVDVTNPRLSWVNKDLENRHNQFQTAWQIRVAGSKEYLLEDKADLWNSGQVVSNESTNIIYGGKPLTSRQDCWWQVRVWDLKGNVSEWSEPSFWSMGLLKPEEWKAKWIGAPWQGEDPIPDNERPLTASRARQGFYTKWIQDILGAQNVKTGYVPNGAPWQPGCGGGVAWGAAISIMPWEFYLQYADTNMLKNNYEGMKGYIKYMLTWTDESGIMLSKALDPDGKPNRWMNLGEWSQPNRLPPDDMVHTFYLWRCADLTAKSAKVLGKKAEYEEYTKLAEQTRQAFQSKFYDKEKGSYGAYGGNIFALKMSVPDDQKERVVAALKADIIANGGHLDTGIFGTQFFFEVLSENGLHDIAYEAMNQRTAPGYGWWIEQGATTSWEGWKNPGSGNHPMFGGGIVWLYRKLAGMNSDPEQPGYRHIIFHPQPVDEISYASYSNLSPYGTCSISWKKENGKFLMEIVVPVGSTATAFVPSTDWKSVMENGKKIKSKAGITFNRIENSYVVLTVGSGRYRFESKLQTKHLLTKS